MSIYLPDELWVKILEYVPLLDRLRNVQFVCRWFHSLVHNTCKRNSLSFQEAVFMSDKECLFLMKNGCHIIESISFKDCHWFSEVVFSNFPSMTCLRSLDITGCFLTSESMRQIFKSSPSIEELVCTLNLESAFLHRLSDISSHAPKLKLKKLHIELFWYRFSQSENFQKRLALLKSYVEDYLMCDGGFDSFSLSINWEGSTLAEYIGIPSKYSVDMGYVPGMKHCIASKSVCHWLSFFGLHSSMTKSTSPLLPSLECGANVNFIRFLSLPYMLEDNILKKSSAICGNEYFPSCMPSLECLIIGHPYFHVSGQQVHSSCFHKLVQFILLNCFMPKLKCYVVDSGGGNATGVGEVPLEFYQRFSTLKRLRELNLQAVPLDPNMSLSFLECCKHIQAISLKIDACGLNQEMLHSSVSQYEPSIGFSNILSQISSLFPYLLMLELNLAVRCDNKAVEPLNSEFFKHLAVLQSLKVLSLQNFPLCDSTVLADSLKYCLQIQKLVLFNVGNMLVCEYPALLREVFPCLSQLKELKLGHDKLIASSETFDCLALGKSLEKIIVFSTFDPSHACDEVFGSIESMIYALPKLHAFILDGLRNQSSALLYEQLDLLWDKLKQSGRVMSMYRAISRHSSGPIQPRCFRMADLLTASTVGDYNPWNFSYS